MSTMKNDFKFSINVSFDGYKNKKDAACCLTSTGAKAIGMKKMCFFERNITVNEFLEYAVNGHSFCSLYRFNPDLKYSYVKDGKYFETYPYYKKDTATTVKDGLKINFKRDEYFSGSQCIFIDIDRTQYTNLQDYMEMLEYKPSAVYMSYSDGKEKLMGREKEKVTSRRFHLVYVFDEILDKDEFTRCSKILSDSLVRCTNEELDDDCGKRFSQYFNGVFGNDETYNTEIIYSSSDLKENIIEDKVEEIIEEVHTLNTKLEKNTTPENEEDVYNFLSKNVITALNDWDRLDLDEFKKDKNWIYLLKNTKNIYRVEKGEWINGLYQNVGEDYFRFYYTTETVVDGMKRRRNLYQRMCLRRLMKEDVTYDELVVNAVLDIIRFYDNSDGVLNADCILHNVYNAMRFDIEKIKEKFSGTISYLHNLTMPKRGIIYKNKQAHSVETTYEILDNLYEPSLNVEENLKVLNEVMGYKIAKSTLYNYLKERKITNKVTDEEIKSLIDLSLSANQNLKILKDSGIKIGNKRLNELYKEKQNQVVEEEVHTLNPILETNTTEVPEFYTDSYFAEIMQETEQNYNNFLNRMPI